MIIRIFLESVLLLLLIFSVARIELVKPDKARAIEDMIIGAARRGGLQGKISEERLVGLLEQVSDQSSSKSTKITIQRRRAFDDEDDF